MGNNASIGEISIAMENTEATPGATVNGTVLLTVAQEEIQCSSISCKVTGREITRVAYVSASKHLQAGNWGVPAVTTSEQRKFLKLDMCLKTVDEGRIARGHQEIPFHFAIPKDFPASMEVHHGGESCKIVYTIEVWLNGPNSKGKKLLRTKQIINAKNAVPHGNRTPVYFIPRKQTLYSLGMVNQGGVLFGGSIEDNVLSAGELTSISCAAINHSTANIKAIEVSLNEQIIFQANDLFANRIVKLFQKRVYASEAAFDLSPRSAGMNETDSDAAERLRAMLSAEVNKIKFVVPTTANSTYYGETITVKHFVTVDIITAFGTTKPSITRDITMYSKCASIENVHDLPCVAAMAEIAELSHHCEFDFLPMATVVPVRM